MQQRNRSSSLYALMQEFEERERSGAITPGDFEARIEQTLRPRIGSPHTLAGEIIRAFKKEGQFLNVVSAFTPDWYDA